MPTSDEIRSIFLDFFTSRGHLRIPGSSLIPVNDPTLLFINSGMAPLKSYFTGEASPPARDLCNVQPCIRTTDIGDVGDRHHLTFFEMLGSWSIGGYGKNEAIRLAYELLVDGFKLDPDRLYATVYRGDPDLNLPPDEESAKAWEAVGLPASHVVWLGEDNFWGPAGATGPCGPCTEVFFDSGDAFGPEYREGAEFDTTQRYIEIWNAGVFMELNKRPDGSFDRLPFTSVDTGSGLERMCVALNQLDSVYDTDLFDELMERVRALMPGGPDAPRGQRIVADHLRAAVFILGEGVLPSNEGRGYIPRRLIRKAMATMSRAGLRQPDLSPLVEAVIDKLAPHYDVLRGARDRILDALQQEQDEFGRSVERGLRRLDDAIGRAHGRIPPEVAFNLFATYGLPLELIEEAAAERGLTLDRQAFDAELERHREVSRGQAQTSAAVAGLPGGLELDDLAATEFVGYERLEADGQVLRVVPDDGEEAAGTVYLVTDRTPFYPAGGGQVGDVGELETPGARLRVVDTVRSRSGVIVHTARPPDGHELAGQVARLRVDPVLRRKTMANHTATHLLHATLRAVLGEHVRQAGSLVEPARLRFDFEHPAALTREEVHEVERLVNRRVLERIPRRVDVMPFDEAIRSGALAFFGDEYDEDVRVVRFGTISAELCGGTHVDDTGQVGMFRIVSEGSIASGVRRIVALTGEEAVEYTLRQDATLRDAAARLHTSWPQLLARIEELGRQKAKPSGGASRPSAADLRSQVRAGRAGVAYGALVVTEDVELRPEASRLAAESNAIALLVAPSAGGRVRYSVAVPPPYRDRFDAEQLVRQLSDRIGGKGGGNAQVAQGGTRDERSPDSVVAALGELLEG